MAWNTLADARAIWRDAPADDPTLGLYLESANASCLAYAPDLASADTEESVTFGVTVADGQIVATDLILSADLPDDYTGTFDVPVEGAFFRFTFAGGVVGGAEIAQIDVPSAWKLAEVMQARNLFNAGQSPTNPSSDWDGSGYGVATYPLDWTVKQLLRPEQGVGAIW
ncbi:hypothetical protein [Microbacterium sp. SLBN-146]|uniref:hypothetical protein n=1 Tax=Microbacterium sp. SLBN-146 TaxID=2768457 RepID=UPI001151C52D|nr:hypothetical protein [Microbacterium sp. SLBN-146]TQJ31950.1 hypothetical protein FBY39_2439 [Microbacterium sp. SLBN-146]